MNKGGKLEVSKTPNAENPWVHGNTPILTMDVWWVPCGRVGRIGVGATVWGGRVGGGDPHSHHGRLVRPKDGTGGRLLGAGGSVLGTGHL